MINLDVSKKNLKEGKKLKKNILKDLKIEITRLDKEIYEIEKLISSYEKIILTSLLYLKDRENLNTSILCGVHNTRYVKILNMITRLPNNVIISLTGKDVSTNNQINNKVADDSILELVNDNKSVQSELKKINSIISSNTDKLKECLDIYVDQLNNKINIMILQRNRLQREFSFIQRL